MSPQTPMRPRVLSRRDGNVVGVVERRRAAASFVRSVAACRVPKAGLALALLVREGLEPTRLAAADFEDQLQFVGRE